MDTLLEILSILLVGYLIISIYYLNGQPKLYNKENSVKFHYYLGLLSFVLLALIFYIKDFIDAVDIILVIVLGFLVCTLAYGHTGMMGPNWYRSTVQKWRRWQSVDATFVNPMDPYVPKTKNIPDKLSRLANEMVGLPPLSSKLFLIYLGTAFVIFILLLLILL